MEGDREHNIKTVDQEIIFFNSYLPRTGHNFAAEVIKIFSEHEVLAHNRSETRISTILDSYYEIRARNFYESDRKFLDTLFINDLRKKILDQSPRKYIMIKDTSFKGVELMPEIFPDDLHFILIRDPKSVFLSLLKGMNLKKRSLRNKVKRFGIPAGLYPYFYSKKISSQVLKKFPDLRAHTIIRYEDLVRKDEKTLLLLKEKFATKKNLEQIKKEIDDIQVINTSFFEETGAKNIWDRKPKTSTFNPLKRKKFSFTIVKAVELGSRELRRKLNYI
ncbi:hypothetical protein SAMN04488034_10437 [Salinimicrobium catena]|uniref:Sulfotransferase family protein n=1 Tax=Salinimicrobium catena TaxID=390640 RepID=A0A1H5NBA1_9FLAO|nr:hypothetical protein [Salinimicrobium catena]SDL41839.1 hypothetical protein SAMN04488140_10437 [Salinimicrobium catena]SEE98853.1 hypothetical protein SAMN04488034_10437 [Salinimicrobium catena]